jgi:hypothetical protein
MTGFVGDVGLMMMFDLLNDRTSCVNTTALSFVLTQKKQKVKQEHITPMFLQTP